MAYRAGTGAEDPWTNGLEGPIVWPSVGMGARVCPKAPF